MLDEEGNALGGKKAALKFIHDQMFGKKANQTELSHSNADQAEPSYPGTTKLNPSKVVSNDLIDDRLDDLLKLSEELKSLESALESMQSVQSMKKNPGNEAGEELAINSETKNILGDVGGEERNQSAYQNQMGGLTPSNRIKAEKLVGLKGSDKVEDRKKPLVKTDDQEMETSQVRKLNRLTDKGFKGRRKSLAGLKV